MIRNILTSLLLIFIFGCKTENKDEVLNNAYHAPILEDTIQGKKEKKNQNFNYKVGHVNDGYGKRLYIDSLHYNIVRRYYYEDSTRLWFDHYSDTKNDTVYKEEFYFNGNLKLIKKLTYHRLIKIGCWKYYNEKGELIKQVDHDSRFPVTFDEAVKIAEENYISKPIETSITKDSLNWIIVNWTEGTFDTVTQETVGNGIRVNIKTGEFEKFTPKRKVEI